MINEEVFKPYQYILSAGGKEAIKAEIGRFREKHGEKWLKNFQAKYPVFAEIADLVANYDKDTAFDRLLGIVHAKIDEEFDRQLGECSYIRSAVERFAKYAAINAARMPAQKLARNWLINNQPQVFALHAELQAEIHKPRF